MGPVRCMKADVGGHEGMLGMSRACGALVDAGFCLASCHLTS